MIFYIMGKSASGKDSLYKKLLLKNIGLKEVTIYTTRPKRDGEINGKEYYFVDDKYLDDNKNRIIEKREYNTVYGKWVYATLDDGKIEENSNYIMIGTLTSYQMLKKYYGDDIMYPIYLQVDNDIRKKRAIEREYKQKIPKLEEMERRFIADEIDFSEENIKKAGILKKYENDNFEKCFSEILNDIKKYV